MVRTRSSSATDKAAAAGGGARSDATRDKLIEAAGRVFAERGFQAATVREICRRAEANVAAINYHFGDKLGLYTAVLQQSVKAAKIEALRHALDGDAPPEEILRRVIRARLESAARQGLPDWQVGIMAHEFAHPTPALAHIVDTVSKPLFARVLDVMGKIAGLPADDRTLQLCAYSLMGPILFNALASPLLTIPWPQGKLPPEMPPTTADHITASSLAYLRQLAAKTR